MSWVLNVGQFGGCALLYGGDGHDGDDDDDVDGSAFVSIY